LWLRSSAKQCDVLLDWAGRYPERRWAIESATGLGYLVAQQLVAAGEDVVDVPPTLSARVWVLDSTKASKNDPHDARSAAIVALRHRHLRSVAADDHAAILRMLANRHHGLTRLRTQAVCRLHAQLATLKPGGLGGTLTAKRARELLETVPPDNGVVAERKQQAVALLADVVRIDTEVRAIKGRMEVAVQATGTSLLDIYGAGPVVASIVLGHVVDVGRFPTSGHFASYAGVAPIEASSGPKKRHRLNPRGNRQLNHALHIIAIAQISHDCAGRIDYDRKITEGKTKKEALRALKRRIADVVYRALVADTARD
ncbi:MAG TPA: IS110 family transposase, partial [Mycobacterium sp.]|nr:IS110 family transposase [Mycobacterium sp.]